MISRTLKLAALSIALSAGTLVVGAGLTATPAEAKKVIIVKHGHHFHHRHLRVTPYYFAATTVGSCYWLKVRALETGSRYWWNRFHACRGY